MSTIKVTNIQSPDSGTNDIIIDANGNVTVDPLYVDATNNRVGIGTTSPSVLLHVKESTGAHANLILENSEGTAKLGTNSNIFYVESSQHIFYNSGGTAEYARLDSSGRLLVGTSTSTTGESDTKLEIVQDGAGAAPHFVIGSSSTTPSTGDGLGLIRFYGKAGGVWEEGARITARYDAAAGSGDKPCRLEFSTTADGASSPTERMRIDSGGNVGIGITSHQASSSSSQGNWIGAPGGFAAFARASDTPLYVNRISDDGNLVELRQNGANEGSISVSGSTVSYNGAHLSRWSQLPGGATREEILRGTVLSNIDEMCEWGEEENEQLNRMKVSDIEGDRNVSGVFQSWDDDDDIYTNDFYCAMTGDFIIRIAQGVTVERGDLLMSAGDGTAKPQDDDIIRSKTIAKVTSTHVTCTYDDGSYCVPCVLMAC